MSQMWSIARKELKAYFGSPMAAIFIGAFLLASLFSFFWVEAFFARNSADIRPLFQWMPLLLLFLVAALTMRQWSEEQKMGTLEILLTMPVSLTQLVLGKFVAVLILVAVALALTLGLPLTVSFMGNLDLGPVIGGYLGALCLAGAYIAIGLFISSKTDNQIIALILTVLVAGLFYLVGSSGIANFAGNEAGGVLRALGTGSRFASIERGVIDLRDLVYYASLATLFLMLNIHALDRKRWSTGERTGSYRRNAVLATVLIAANLLAANVWLARYGALRLDLTQDREYSISGTTRDLLANLQEPLILRGYFSEKTHPYLSPLVPRIKDLMTEYAIASRGNVTVSFVDPKYDQEQEAEANQQYGIKPIPFQVAGRYEASVVSSYFNILVKYGDQFVTLGFEDLIEVRQRKDGQLDVSLRNLEYDLTKSIKKVAYGFQSVASVFEKSNKPMKLIALVSSQNLPQPLAEAPAALARVAADLQKDSAGKLSFEQIDPAAKGLSAEEVKRTFGVEPMPVALFSNTTFYFHLLLQVGDAMERIYLGGDMSEAEIRKEVEATLKRSSSGFLKTIGVWAPKSDVPPQMAMMQQQREPERYTLIQKVLRENYNVTPVDLSSGRVGGDVDVLLVVAPQSLTDKERFAVDQFLMRGGAVVALAGNYVLDLSPYSQALKIKKVTGGLGDLLAHYGVKVGESLIMDQQNEPFPIPVERDLGGFTVREIRRMDYPFFVDVRADGMDAKSPVMKNLPAVTLNWASPVTADKQKLAGARVSELLRSSAKSWTTTSTEAQPNFTKFPGSGFPAGSNFEPQVLAVSLQGSFASYFKDKPDPRAADEKDADKKKDEGKAPEAEKKPEKAPPEPLVAASPDNARLVVVGSSEFVNDAVIEISRSLGGDRFLNSLSLLQNLIDWSVEDEELLAIRSRGAQARLLVPMERGEQKFWEYLNYGLAILALVAVSGFAALRRRREKPMELVSA